MCGLPGVELGHGQCDGQAREAQRVRMVFYDRPRDAFCDLDPGVDGPGRVGPTTSTVKCRFTDSVGLLTPPPSVTRDLPAHLQRAGQYQLHGAGRTAGRPSLRA